MLNESEVDVENRIVTTTSYWDEKPTMDHEIDLGPLAESIIEEAETRIINLLKKHKLI